MISLLAILVPAALAAPPSPAEALPRSLDPQAVRALVVQHDGRWPPLDTLARDVVESVTGRAFYLGRDPVLWLLAWTFEPRAFADAPLIPVGGAALRVALGLPADREVFSYAELAGHARLGALARDAARVPQGRKLDPLQAKVRQIEDRLGLMREALEGRLIRPIPGPSDEEDWQPIDTNSEKLPNKVEPVGRAWAALGEAFRSDDAAAFASAADELQVALEKLPAGYWPDPARVATELRYNRLRPFRLAWIVMGAGALLAGVAAAARRKGLSVLAGVGLVAGLAVLTYGLSLRWAIAGRVPAANMYESLLLLSWGAGAFAILSMILIRDRLVPLTASGIGVLALVLADNLPLDHFIRPIAPVLLDTAWMSIHVPVIMVSYSVLALAALIAHAQMVVMAAAPRRGSLIAAIDALHHWYLHAGCILLGAGIVTGSLWAASSWGRYWGWDPKEVWSLVALLAYLAILHRRLERDRPPLAVQALGLLLSAAVIAVVAWTLRPSGVLGVAALLAGAGAVPLAAWATGPFATALKSALAFWLIIMTYVGVNYVLGMGLHSYGFGTGAVARYLFVIGGVDLTLLALCTGAYLARHRAGPAGGIIPPGPP